MNALFASDYQIALLENKHGELCSTYPPQIILLEREVHDNKQTDSPSDSSSSPPSASSCISHHLEHLMHESRFARVHGRFVVPVIFIQGKHVCRSATTSVDVETIFNNVTVKTKNTVKQLLNYLFVFFCVCWNEFTCNV